MHICICIIHIEYFWLVMAGLKEKLYTLILKFAYITFCLLATELQTILQLKILMTYTFIAKFFWVCAFRSFVAHLFQSSFNWFDLFLTVEFFFWVLASSLHSLKGDSIPPFLRHPPLDAACPPFLKSLFPLPSFLFYPILRYFRQFSPPSCNLLLP